jgi:hypothetical protein
LSFVNFNSGIHIGVMDCSFISKSGKRTFGIDKFWSVVASKANLGLEISVLGCINVITSKAYFLDAIQTPSGLSKKKVMRFQELIFNCNKF